MGSQSEQQGKDKNHQGERDPTTLPERSRSSPQQPYRQRDGTEVEVVLSDIPLSPVPAASLFEEIA